MGRETKFGLLVGLVFIVLFGVILSSHANLSATDHAVMPTGESQAHATRAQSLHGTVDPFVQDAPLDVSGNPAAVGPVEEPLPAPSHLAADVPPASVTDTTVTLGYGPVTVETPGDRARGTPPAPWNAGGPGLPRPAVTATGASIAVADASRPVYVVKQGDTLSSIAHQFYGKDWPKLLQQIVDANKTTLRDPKKVLVGMKLVIPNVPASAPRTDAPKTDAPKTDAPKAGAPAPAAPAAPVDLDYNDTSLAVDGRPAPRTVEDVRRALREVTVPADGGRTPPGTIPVVHYQEDPHRSTGGPADASAKTYAIQAGDTFNKIAAKLYGDGNKYGKLLAQKNPGVDPSHLKIGQRIVLLDTATAAAVPAAPAAPAADTVVALR